LNMAYPLASDLDEILAGTRVLWESVRGQRLFITGGSGFVGTWLTQSLLWADERLDLGVEVLLLTRDPDRFRNKAPFIAKHKSIKLLRGNTQSFTFPGGHLGFVIHAATEAPASFTTESPTGTFDADLAGTRRVLEFARHASVRRMLFTSSGAVYGRQPETLATIREDYPGAPATTDLSSAYAQGKRGSEFLCAMYSRQFGFDATIARLFAFVGPYLSLEHYAVGNFIRDAIQGRAIEIQSDGSTVRSYLYAADMAIWLWTIFLRGESLRPYNVGSPEAISVRELASTIAELSGNKRGVTILGRPGVPSTRYVPNTSRTEKELGLKVRIPLKDAIKRTIDWHVAQRAGHEPIEAAEVSR
jgi:dTDP-glucose 4,6-dehydratase